jgi:hypothetical protein
MDKVYITLREMRNLYKILVGNPELIVNRMLILKYLLQAYDNRVGAEFVRYETRTNDGLL